MNKLRLALLSHSAQPLAAFWEGPFAVMWGSDIRGRRIGRVGVVEEIKEPREAEERKESKRAQGPLVKHKGGERERTFDVRVKLQISTP